MHMKIGCCLNMLAHQEDEIGIAHLDALCQSGYDYVELPLAQLTALSEERFAELVKQLILCGMPCECCNNFFPASIRLTGDNVNHAQIVAYIERAVQRAKRLGVNIIVFGSSGAKNIPDGFDAETAFEQVVRTLREAGAICAAAGITIVIEPLCGNESNLILTLAQASGLMKAVNLPNVRLLVDYYHFTKEQEQMNTLEDFVQSIHHAHFSDPDGRVFPCAPCDACIPFFETLQKGAHCARCSVEAYSEQPIQDLPQAIAVMHHYVSFKTEN